MDLPDQPCYQNAAMNIDFEKLTPRPYEERKYASYATPGSKEAKRRSALLRVDLVLDYCHRTGKPAPKDATEFRGLWREYEDDHVVRMRAHCAALRELRHRAEPMGA